MLCIEGRATLHREFSSEEFNVELDENALLARDPGWNEGTISSLSNFIWSNSSNNDEEEGKEVN